MPTDCQLESRRAGASQRHSCCPVHSRANAFCGNRAGASHQIDHATIFVQRWRWGRFRAMLWPSFFYAFFLVKSSYRYSLVRIFPTSSSKKAPNASALTFWTIWSAKRALAITVPCALRRKLSQSEPQKERPYLFGERQSQITGKNGGCPTPEINHQVSYHTSALPVPWHPRCQLLEAVSVTVSPSWCRPHGVTICDFQWEMVDWWF